MLTGGVDIFLDSVGGSMHTTILTKHMRIGGRICIFGNLSLYNNHNNLEMVTPNDLIISLKVFDNVDRDRGGGEGGGSLVFFANSFEGGFWFSWFI